MGKLGIECYGEWKEKQKNRKENFKNERGTKQVKDKHEMKGKHQK